MTQDTKDIYVDVYTNGNDGYIVDVRNRATGLNLVERTKTSGKTKRRLIEQSRALQTGNVILKHGL